MSTWIDLGYGRMVRAESVVAIAEADREADDRIYSIHRDRYVYARAVVLLASGQLIPSHVTVTTLRKWLRANEEAS